MPIGTKDTIEKKKRGFWLPNELYFRVKAFVSKHRNAPEDMTINSFVRSALEEKLQRDQPAAPTRRARA